MHSASSALEGNLPRRGLAACLPFCWLLAACGAPQQPTSNREPPAGEQSESALDEPGATDTTDPAEAADAPDVDTDDADSAASSENPNEIRDVVYKMTRGGLEIEVDGILFRPLAEPVKVQGGAWGVKITMEAESVGDGARHLLNPKGGPLAFAGSVTRKGKAEEFGDKRDGEDVVELAPGATQSFESTWPKDKTQSALWWGNELSLEAGLWGLGKSRDALRPVRQFFTLKMVAGNKPQPVIQPPKSAE